MRCNECNQYLRSRAAKEAHVCPEREEEEEEEEVEEVNETDSGNESDSTSDEEDTAPSARKRARLERKSKSAHHHKKKEKKKSKRSARHQKKRSGRRSKSSSSDSSSTDSDTDSKDSSSYDDSSTYDSSEDGYNEELDTVKNFHPNGKGWRSKERLKAAAEAFGAEVRRHPAPPWLNKLLDHTVSMAIYLFEDNRRSLKMRRRASVAASKNFLLALQVYGRSRGIEDRDVEREVAGLSSKDRKSPRKVVRAFRKALDAARTKKTLSAGKKPHFSGKRGPKDGGGGFVPVPKTQTVPKPSGP